MVGPNACWGFTKHSRNEFIVFLLLTLIASGDGLTTPGAPAPPTTGDGPGRRPNPDPPVPQNDQKDNGCCGDLGKMKCPCEWAVKGALPMCCFLPLCYKPCRTRKPNGYCCHCCYKPEPKKKEEEPTVEEEEEKKEEKIEEEPQTNFTGGNATDSSSEDEQKNSGSGPPARLGIPPDSTTSGNYAEQKKVAKTIRQEEEAKEYLPESKKDKNHVKRLFEFLMVCPQSVTGQYLDNFQVKASNAIQTILNNAIEFTTASPVFVVARPPKKKIRPNSKSAQKDEESTSLQFTVYPKSMSNDEWKKVCGQLNKLSDDKNYSLTKPVLKAVDHLIGKTGSRIAAVIPPEGWNKAKVVEKKNEEKEEVEEPWWWEGMDSGVVFLIISAGCFVLFGFAYMTFGEVELIKDDSSSSSSVPIPNLFAPIAPNQYPNPVNPRMSGLSVPRSSVYSGGPFDSVSRSSMKA